MGWVTMEMKDNYGQTKHKQTFIAASAAEAVDHSRAETLLDLQRAKDKLQEIDDKILQLAYEREYAINNLEIVGNQALGSWLCSSDALEMVACTYKRLGWKSKLACEFVRYLRSILFDDSEKAFKNIMCYGIELDNYVSDGSIKKAVNVFFGPKKYDHNKIFKIYLVGKGGMKFDWKGQFIETNIKVFKMNGGTHSWDRPMIARSPKLVDIREAICRLVMFGEYDDLEFGPCERDKVQEIVGSLVDGDMRSQQAEKMFGYKRVMAI